MKKIIYLSIALCCFLFSSCSDFLKEENWVDVEKSKFYNNAQEAETVLLGAYRNLVTEGAYGYHLSILFNLGTDLSQVNDPGNSSSWRMAAHNSFNSTLGEIETTWKTLYAAVYDVNDFLERCSAKIDEWETVADRNLGVVYIAEARALRAMLYFELVRRFGNIPLMTSTAQSKQHPSTFVQADPVDVYRLIEEDLLYAVNTLPYSCSDTYRADNRYRFSKGAAMGLLTKVYATWAGYPLNDTSKWEDAAKMAQKLIYSGKHDLLPEYETLWKNTCNGIWDPTESLIEISMYSPTAAGGASDPCGRIGKWNGVKTTSVAGVRGRCAANVNAVHTFVLEWRDAKHAKDLRRDLSIANYKYDDDKVLLVKGKSDSEQTAINNDADKNKKQKEKQTYTPAKWDIQKYVEEGKGLINDDKSNVNWYFLRYADVLLLYAEALNEWKGGPTDEAYAAINKVRRRGYGNPSNTSVCDLSGMSQDEFRQAIRDERAFELAFEGHRRMDLVRWGIYYETVQETDNALLAWWTGSGSYNYDVAKNTVKGKHELLPIPLREKDLCTQFKQNPNW